MIEYQISFNRIGQIKLLICNARKITQGQLCLHISVFLACVFLYSKLSLHIYIYIYIYVCVCVCV